MQRAYDRMLEIGKRVPTVEVIRGAANASQATPKIFNHPNVDLGIYNTDVPRGSPPELIASWNPETSSLDVHDPDAFIDFVERQNLNKKARSPEQLLKPSQTTADKFAKGCTEYVKRGATINFLDADGHVALTMSPDGVDVIKPLEITRGVEFFEGVVEASTKRISQIGNASVRADLEAKIARDAPAPEGPQINPVEADAVRPVVLDADTGRPSLSFIFRENAPSVNFMSSEFAPSMAVPSPEHIATAAEHLHMAEALNREQSAGGDLGLEKLAVAGVSEADADTLLRAFTADERHAVSMSQRAQSPFALDGLRLLDSSYRGFDLGQQSPGGLGN